MREIIATRCKYFDVFDSDKIIEALVKTGDIFPVATVIAYIELGDIFYISGSDEKILSTSC